MINFFISLCLHIILLILIIIFSSHETVSVIKNSITAYVISASFYGFTKQEPTQQNKINTIKKNYNYSHRHCEKTAFYAVDEAIHHQEKLDCFAPAKNAGLAMTVRVVTKNLSLKKLTVNKINKLDKINDVDKNNKINLNKNFVSNQKNLTPYQKDPKSKETLASLLHQAIAQKQSYPASALMLSETGTTRIRFLLYPDGHIEHISLLKSSGFASLDSSALTALNAITPVKAAGIYLHRETFFSVDVIFE